MTVNSKRLLSAFVKVWTVAQPWNVLPFWNSLHSCSQHKAAFTQRTTLDGTGYGVVWYRPVPL